jgi:hypothetical protein
MQKVVIVFFLLIASVQLQAQLNFHTKSAATETKEAVTGKLITQFAGYLQASALKAGFQKQKMKFISDTENAKNIGDIEKQVSTLVQNIQPAMFINNNAAGLLPKAGTVKTYSQIGAILKNVQASLKPEAFTTFWKVQQPHWIESVDKIK